MVAAELVQAIVALQRDHGDREQRRHARMKYLLHDRGIAWFREELGRYFQHPLQPLRILAPRCGWLGSSYRQIALKYPLAMR